MIAFWCEAYVRNRMVSGRVDRRSSAFISWSTCRTTKGERLADCMSQSQKNGRSSQVVTFTSAEAAYELCIYLRVLGCNRFWPFRPSSRPR
ncbi:hypothetical protein EI94DRAFT_1724846, partial [Lactarius quietus]